MESIVPYKEAFSKYIPEQYKNSEKLLSLVNTCLDQCDSLENAFFEILQALNLQDAIGPALDWLGAIVGVERIPGESDSSYRSRIVSGMNLKNLPSNEALRLVIKFLTGCDSVGLFPNWPAETYYVLDGSTDADLSALEHDSMTSGASLVRGTFLCMESGEGGYLVNDDNGMPFVVDYVETAEIPVNVFRFTFSDTDYDPTVAGVGPHGTWTKVATSNKNEWDWQGTPEHNEFDYAFTVDLEDESLTNWVTVRCSGYTDEIDCYEMFYGCSAITSATLNGMSGVINAFAMFWYCRNLKTLTFNGAVNNKNLSYFADSCTNLETVMIDTVGSLDSDDTSYAHKLYYSFAYCYNLRRVIISDLYSVHEFPYTFYLCYKLDDVYFDILNAVKMESTFRGCKELKTVVLSNTDNVQEFSYTFHGCESLEKAPDMDCSSAVRFLGCFRDCEKLVDVPAYGMPNCTIMTQAFENCTCLEYLPTFQVGSLISLYRAFYGCTALKEIPKWDTSSVSDFSYTFYGCTALKEIQEWLDVSGAYNAVDFMFYGCVNIEHGAVELYNKLVEISPEYNQGCFEDCGVATLTGIGDLCKIPTAWGGLGPLPENTLLFSFSKSDYSPTVAGLSGTWAQFDTGYSENAFNLWTWQDLSSSWISKFYDSTTLVGTFVDSANLVDIIAAGDTSSVTTVKNMFTRNTSLNSICLFDTSSVVDFSSFVAHTGIFELPLFDTSHATTINSIAYDCKNLLSVPLLNTSSITSYSGIEGAFEDCFNVESGAYDLYKQLKSQTFTGSMQYLPFSNCGSNKLTGISDLLNISSAWGGDDNLYWGKSIILSFSDPDYNPATAGIGSGGTWTRVDTISQFNAWRWYKNVTDWSELFKDAFTDPENLVYILAVGSSVITNVDRMFDGCTAIEGGSLKAYTKMSTQATPPASYADTFFDCGTLTENGTVELLGVSCHWGGNDLYLMLTDDYVGFMPDETETEFFIEYIRMYQDLVAMFRNIETKRIYI